MIFFLANTDTVINIYLYGNTKLRPVYVAARWIYGTKVRFCLVLLLSNFVLRTLLREPTTWWVPPKKEKNRLHDAAFLISSSVFISFKLRVPYSRLCSLFGCWRGVHDFSRLRSGRKLSYIRTIEYLSTVSLLYTSSSKNKRKLLH